MLTFKLFCHALPCKKINAVKTMPKFAHFTKNGCLFVNKINVFKKSYPHSNNYRSAVDSSLLAHE